MARLGNFSCLRFQGPVLVCDVCEKNKKKEREDFPVVLEEKPRRIMTVKR